MSIARPTPSTSGSVPPPHSCRPKKSESIRIQPGAGAGPAGAAGAAGAAATGAAAGAGAAAGGAAASWAQAAPGSTAPSAAIDVIKAILVRIANLRVFVEGPRGGAALIGVGPM